MARVLRLDRLPADDERRQIGRIHPDGSITFRGQKYRTLGEVPPGCRALRPDVSCHCQWRAIYRQIDPRREGPRRIGGRAAPPDPAV